MRNTKAQPFELQVNKEDLGHLRLDIELVPFSTSNRSYVGGYFQASPTQATRESLRLRERLLSPEAEVAEICFAGSDGATYRTFLQTFTTWEYSRLKPAATVATFETYRTTSSLQLGLVLDATKLDEAVVQRVEGAAVAENQVLPGDRVVSIGDVACMTNEQVARALEKYDHATPADPIQAVLESSKRGQVRRADNQQLLEAGTSVKVAHYGRVLRGRADGKFDVLFDTGQQTERVAGSEIRNLPHSQTGSGPELSEGTSVVLFYEAVVARQCSLEGDALAYDVQYKAHEAPPAAGPSAAGGPLSYLFKTEKGVEATRIITTLPMSQRTQDGRSVVVTRKGKVKEQRENSYGVVFDDDSSAAVWEIPRSAAKVTPRELRYAVRATSLCQRRRCCRVRASSATPLRQCQTNCSLVLSWWVV